MAVYFIIVGVITALLAINPINFAGILNVMVSILKIFLSLINLVYGLGFLMLKLSDDAEFKHNTLFNKNILRSIYNSSMYSIIINLISIPLTILLFSNGYVLAPLLLCSGALINHFYKSTIKKQLPELLSTQIHKRELAASGVQTFLLYKNNE